MDTPLLRMTARLFGGSSGRGLHVSPAEVLEDEPPLLYPQNQLCEAKVNKQAADIDKSRNSG